MRLAKFRRQFHAAANYIASNGRARVSASEPRLRSAPAGKPIELIKAANYGHFSMIESIVGTIERSRRNWR
jgi:hypothetical protein